MKRPFPMAPLMAVVSMWAHVACSAQSNSGGVASPGQSPDQEEAQKSATPPPAASPATADGEADERRASTTQPEAAPAPVKNVQYATSLSPTDEIIVALPRPVGGGEDEGASALPEDSAELRKRALKELEEGNTDNALSMIDVLLVMDPNDAELLEVRGDVMLKRGLTEDAAVDFKRCCEIGRQSCCR